MTANDYANIQRMIDASLLVAIGRHVQDGMVPDPEDKDNIAGQIATIDDVSDACTRLERDTCDDLQSAISEVQHAVNMLQNTVDEMEA